MYIKTSFSFVFFFFFRTAQDRRSTMSPPSVLKSQGHTRTLKTSILGLTTLVNLRADYPRKTGFLTPPARLPFPRGGVPGARSSGGAHWLHAGPAPAFAIPTGRARRVLVLGEKNPALSTATLPYPPAHSTGRDRLPGAFSLAVIPLDLLLRICPPGAPFSVQLDVCICMYVYMYIHICA